MELLAPALRQADVFLLAGLRLLGLLSVAPVFSHRSVPVAVRVAMAALLALVVAPTLAAGEWTPLQLVWLAARESLVGVLLGFAAALVFAAVQFGGELLDLDLGFAMANLLDPGSSEHLPLTGSLLYTLAMLIYLSSGGYRGLLRLAVASYQAVPLGGLSLGPGAQAQVMQMAAGIFSGAVFLVAPAMAALLLSSLALAVINRAVPQLNVFMVGLPAKLVAGVGMLALALPLWGGALARLLAVAEGDLLRLLLRLAGG